LLTTLIRCEPEPLLALADVSALVRSAADAADRKYKVATALAEVCDRELVAAIGWAKQIPGFSVLDLNVQMGLLQSGWPEVLTLALAQRSRSTNSTRKLSSLKFAADVEISEELAASCGLGDYFKQVSLTSPWNASKVNITYSRSVVTWLLASIACECDVKNSSY